MVEFFATVVGRSVTRNNRYSGDNSSTGPTDPRWVDYRVLGFQRPMDPQTTIADENRRAVTRHPFDSQIPPGVWPGVARQYTRNRPTAIV